MVVWLRPGVDLSSGVGFRPGQVVLEPISLGMLSRMFSLDGNI